MLGKSTQAMIPEQEASLTDSRLQRISLSERFSAAVGENRENWPLRDKTYLTRILDGLKKIDGESSWNQVVQMLWNACDVSSLPQVPGDFRSREVDRLGEKVPSFLTACLKHYEDGVVKLEDYLTEWQLPMDSQERMVEIGRKADAAYDHVAVFLEDHPRGVFELRRAMNAAAILLNTTLSAVDVLPHGYAMKQEMAAEAKQEATQALSQSVPWKDLMCSFCLPGESFTSWIKAGVALGTLGDNLIGRINAEQEEVRRAYCALEGPPRSASHSLIETESIFDHILDAGERRKFQKAKLGPWKRDDYRAHADEIRHVSETVRDAAKAAGISARFPVTFDFRWGPSLAPTGAIVIESGFEVLRLTTAFGVMTLVEVADVHEKLRLLDRLLTPLGLTEVKQPDEAFLVTKGREGKALPQTCEPRSIAQTASRDLHAPLLRLAFGRPSPNSRK